jgi:hypothetical protein
MFQATWNEVQYCPDISCATKEAHTENEWESFILRKKLSTVFHCSGVTHSIINAFRDIIILFRIPFIWTPGIYIYTNVY